MRQRVLSLFISFLILFTGCSTKTLQPLRTNIEIRTFLTDKDESFYMFVGEKYSYIFKNKKSLDELKSLIKVAHISRDWKLINKPQIYLEKDFTAKIFMTFEIKAKSSQIAYLKSLGFIVDKDNSRLYHKDITLIGKYGRTDTEIKEKFQSNYLSHSIIFEEFNVLSIKDTETPMALKVLGTPLTVLAGLIAVPLLILSIIFSEYH